MDLVQQAREQLMVAYNELYKEASTLAAALTKAGDDAGGLPLALSLVNNKRQQFYNAVVATKPQ